MVQNTRNEKYSSAVVSRFHRYFLRYWYDRNVVDYQEWFLLRNQRKLMSYILKTGIAVKTIRAVIQSINMFFRYLHEASDGEITDYKYTFPSLTREVCKKHEIERLKNIGNLDKRYSGHDYISEAQFKKIYKHLSNTNNPVKWHAWVAYYYGLRRSETLAVSADIIKKGCIEVTEQLVAYASGEDPVFAPLKHSKTLRKVPHWHGKSLDVVATIFNNAVYMHPTTLTNFWSKAMDEMDLRFTFHNLRCSFCSNALRDLKKRDVSVTDVQLAMGHSSVNTTMIYLRDYRDLDTSKNVKLKDDLELTLDDVV